MGNLRKFAAEYSQNMGKSEAESSKRGEICRKIVKTWGNLRQNCQNIKNSVYTHSYITAYCCTCALMSSSNWISVHE